MSAVIVNPNQNVPVNKKSHVKGWFDAWQQLLGAKIATTSEEVEAAAVVYVGFGPNYSGTLNLFGGADRRFWSMWSALAKRAEDGKAVTFLENRPAKLASSFAKRIGSKSTWSGADKQMADKISQFAVEHRTLLSMEDYADFMPCSPICVGDSHTLAYAKEDSAVLKYDGKTAYGTIKNGIESILHPRFVPGRDITLSLGSVDIRHHVLRQERPLVEIFSISKGIIHIAESLKSLGANVSIAAPVPVEHEARRIPKTGWFKDQPFFGTREDRLQCTLQMIGELSKSDISVVCPPMEWYTMNPEEYASEHMELSSSVHIGAHRHRRFNDHLYTSRG